MQCRPLADEPRCAWRKFAVEHLAGRNGDTRSVLAVESVEMRRRVILDEHPDHDAIEGADRRHEYPSSSVPTIPRPDQLARRDTATQTPVCAMSVMGGTMRCANQALVQGDSIAIA